MKRLIVLATSLALAIAALLAGPASAATPYVGVYRDANFTGCYDYFTASDANFQNNTYFYCNSKIWIDAAPIGSISSLHLFNWPAACHGSQQQQLVARFYLDINYGGYLAYELNAANPSVATMPLYYHGYQINDMISSMWIGYESCNPQSPLP